MAKTIISEGKTSTEAIEKGLKQLKTTRSNVEIKVLEDEDKRSFFSILAPRVVKVELTLKEDKPANRNQRHIPETAPKEPKKEIIRKEEEKVDAQTLEKAKENLEKFLDVFLKNLGAKEVEKQVIIEDNAVVVSLNSDVAGILIGYRGETLNALQTILSSIANNGLEERCKVLVDIQGYRKKREKTLEELASKVAKTVIRTGKSITLEPMAAFERKIIHSKIQEFNKVKTYSIGEEPYRKIVITLK